MTKQISIAIIGLGKIAQDQHVPVLQAHPSFHVAATVSGSTQLDGVANYASVAALLKSLPDLQALSLCMPPGPRFEIAMQAIDAGKHILLEKPPGTNTQQVKDMQAAAARRGVVLHTSWHSRHGPAIAPAKRALADRQIKSVRIDWCEDVKKWHPGQDWIWQPGGMGVFDPGINALSILTALVDAPIQLVDAALSRLPGKAMPITAQLKMTMGEGAPIDALFDWRPVAQERWQITFETDNGLVEISQGGAALRIDGVPVKLQGAPEYQGVYDHFAELVHRGQSDVDFAPLALVEQALQSG